MDLADEIELGFAAPAFFCASASTEPGTLTETGTKYAVGEMRK